MFWSGFTIQPCEDQYVVLVHFTEGNFYSILCNVVILIADIAQGGTGKSPRPCHCSYPYGQLRLVANPSFKNRSATGIKVSSSCQT